MFVKRFNIYLILTVLAVSLFICSPARAFFPSDDEINETLYAKYGTLTSYEAVLTFPGYPGTSLTVRRGHDHWQQEFSVEGSNSTQVSKSVGQYFKTIASCPGASNLPAPVLQIWAPDDPVSDWMSIGVSNATRSYVFNESSPVFVLGAEAGDDSSPQIWFDNENFTLLKIVLGPGQEISFSNYAKYVGIMLPRSGVFRAGEESLEFRIEWRGIRKKIDPAVFAAVNVKKAKGCTLPSGPVFEILEKCLRLQSTDQ